MKKHNVEVGKSYIITGTKGGQDWKVGDGLEVIACILYDEECPEWRVIDKEGNGCKVWCSGLYTYAEVVKEDTTSNFDSSKLSPKSVKQVKKVKTPEYVGKYKLILYYTNGKTYRANSVHSFCYTEVSKEIVTESFNYTKLLRSKNSFDSLEIVEVDIKVLAGFAVKDNSTGEWAVRPIKPCFYKKHSFHIGKEG